MRRPAPLFFRDSPPAASLSPSLSAHSWNCSSIRPELSSPSARRRTTLAAQPGEVWSRRRAAALNRAAPYSRLPQPKTANFVSFRCSAPKRSSPALSSAQLAASPRVLRRDRVALGVLVRRDQHQRDGRVDQVLGVEVVRRPSTTSRSMPCRVRERVAPACAPADARCPSASRTGSGRSPARQPARPRARRPTGRARRRRTRREVSSRPRSEAPRGRRTRRSRRATHPRSWSVSLPSVPVTRLARGSPPALRARAPTRAHSSARVEMPVPRLSRARSVLLARRAKVVASGFSWRRWYVVGSFLAPGRASPAVIKRHLGVEFFRKFTQAFGYSLHLRTVSN